MSVPTRRFARAGTLSAALVSVLLTIASTASTAATAAGPASGLCSMNTQRGAVPASFALEACVDRSAIVLRNQLSVPVRISATGSSARIVAISSDMSIASRLTRIAHPGPEVMMPGDVIRVPIGSGEAAVSIVDTDAGGFHALATTLAAFIPAGAAVQVYEAVAQGITEMVDANLRYQNCLAHANWLQQIG